MAQNDASQFDMEARDKLFDLIKDIRIAMMTTVDRDGSLRSRPMYNHKADTDGRLWFFTKLGSPKTQEISQGNQVNLGYADTGSENYVSVSGTARIVQDPGKIKELWSEGLRVWFPKGSDDPDISLICVEPQKGEYWDSPSSTLVHLYGYVKARVMGEPPYELSETKKVAM